jgi:hypothetical protein
MAFYQYAIASGYSVALNSLTNIETISVSGRRFTAPKALGSFDPGIFRVRPDGTLYLAGYPSQRWLFEVITFAQYNYLRSTYCAGGYAGKVTVYTRPGTEAYARYNAVLRLPKPVDHEDAFFAFKQHGALLTKMVAL